MIFHIRLVTQSSNMAFTVIIFIEQVRQALKNLKFVQ